MRKAVEATVDSLLGTVEVSCVSCPNESNFILEKSCELLGNPEEGQSAAKLLQKPLTNIDEDYIIYSNGKVFSKKVNRFLVGKVDNQGYRAYALKGKMYYAHRLVAETFLLNPNNLPYVHHKDEIN